MKSTPIAMMEKTPGAEPLESRRQAKLLTHDEKMKRLPDHPLHSRLQDLTKNRLKRKSMNHLVKQHQKRQTDILTDNIELCERLNPNTWTQKPLLGEIRTNIPGITVKKTPEYYWAEDSDHGGDRQTLPCNNLDPHLHWWISRKCHTKWRMRRFHQETRIAFCFTVKTRWKSVLQLQSGTQDTLQCYRGSETGKENPKNQSFSQTPFQQCSPWPLKHQMTHRRD